MFIQIVQMESSKREFIWYLQVFFIKIQSCDLYNNKYMIASIQITQNEVFTSIAVEAFKLVGNRVLFIDKKDNRNCQKVG